MKTKNKMFKMWRGGTSMCTCLLLAQHTLQLQQHKHIWTRVAGLKLIKSPISIDGDWLIDYGK